MLTPEEIDALIEPMQPLIDDLNTFILKDIVSRLMARLKHEDPFKLSQSDIWQLEVLKMLTHTMKQLRTSLLSGLVKQTER